jgi:MucR family transcriptional regulator, transcriptional regulator of exopolysaccharide biosynthesis
MKVWCKNMDRNELDLTSLTADIVSVYVAHNALTGDKLPDLIGSVYGALSRASLQAVEPEKVELKPAVAIKKSVTPDYIVCLEDGKKFKSLKRHLRSEYNMSPEEYREKWGLPHDYPMVAANYAAMRSDMAKNIGLGRRGTAVAGTQPEVTAKAEAAEKSGKHVGKQTRKAGKGSR